MTLVCEYELRAIKEQHAGLIPSSIYSCVDEEVTAFGAFLTLKKDDVITSTHCDHWHLITKGSNPKCMMAKLAASSPFYCLGLCRSLHIAHFDLGFLEAIGILAGGIPIAVGGNQDHEMDPTAYLCGVQTNLCINASYKPGCRNYGKRVAYSSVNHELYRKEYEV